MLFKRQAEHFMQSATTRRRNPVRPQTAKIYQSYLDAHILPLLGDAPTYTIENGAMKKFVSRLSEKKLSPSTINQIFNVATAVLASETDSNGNEVNPRTWNHDFIDLPIVNKTDTRAEIVTPEQIEAAIHDADPTLRALIVLLASTGLRIGEALALLSYRVNVFGTYWNPETATVHVKSTLVRGKIEPQPKTDAGRREIDLHPDVNEYLKLAKLDTFEYRDEPGRSIKEGFLFKNSVGNHARVETLYDQLESLGLDTGFHAFRRFRATHLESQGVPRSLTAYWLGHGGGTITDRYIKIDKNLEIRKEWAEKAGFGFKLQEKI
jgi:integrase